MTSAQYLSNLGQEKAKSVKENFNNPALFNISVGLIGGNSEKSQMSKGITDQELDKFKEYIDFIFKMDSFTAYVREAIKDKEETLDGISMMSMEQWIKYSGHSPWPVAVTFSEWLESVGKVSPVVSTEEPERPTPEITDIKVLVKKLPLKEYQEYLDLDTKAAVLGKLCHSDKAPLVIARRELLEVLGKPLKKDGEGRDTCIYEYTPSVSTEKFEGIFEDLQAMYREAEKKLNKVRFDLREAETVRYQTESSEYKKKLEAWNQEVSSVDQANRDLRQEYTEYRNEIGRQQIAVRAEFEEWKVSERSRISKLKIVIPEALQDTYEYLEGLGKKEEKKS
jgi:hypothetical protein